MGFFQDTVVNKYLKTNDSNIINQAYIRYKEHFHNLRIQENIRNSKEEQYQGEFLIDLFVKVLGYTKNPTDNFNLTTEYKNVKDSKKADGAILINGVVKAVIELKGTNTTDLGKIEEQAFGYKNNQPECIYVITSNFEKLRLYIDNAIEHIEFNLFTLNYKDFELLYVCLAYENIEKNIPKKIKDESLSEEDVITKKLYKDYSIFKSELFHNIVSLNPDIDSIDLFQKTQKLIDRFLFLFFAEDRSLLPPNSVRLILSDWRDLQDRDEDIGLYDRFKKYFEYLNTGYKGKRYEVFAYNGGLFKLDEILDVLKIDDELLYKHTLKLSEYNFNSEVDVNILGHIFENSLNELDELKAQSEGEAIDRKKTRRKKDGVFYTPKYITKYIVDNTVGKLCLEKKQEIDIRDEDFIYDKKRPKKTTLGYIEKINQYKEWLLQLTICDPACGSGAFLNQALDFLIKEHKYLDELQAKLLGEALVFSDIEKSILENNLYGVDINEESVEIAKLSLWLRTAQPNRKLNDLNNNIKCGNSLIDDPDVAGDKAFNWNNEFPDIFSKGGFDVVIGNPPYVRAESFLNIKEHLSKMYNVFNGNADLYSFFYEKSIMISKQSGLISLITPNKWIQSNYGNELRVFISRFKILEIIDFGELPIFEDASTFPIIISIQKKKEINSFNFREITTLRDAFNVNERKNLIQINQKLLDNTNWILKGEQILNIIKKLEKTNSRLGEVFGNKFLAGIKTGANNLFIYTLDQVNEITKGNENEKKLFKPILFGQDFDKYIITQTNIKYLFFPYTYVNETNCLIDLTLYPITYNFLKSNESEFAKRAIIKEGIIKGTHVWYELQQINKNFDYAKPKIIYPDIAKENRFIYDNNGLIPDMTCFFIPSMEKEYLPILNSSFFKFLASNYCPILGTIKTGGRIRYKSTYLSKIPFTKLNSQTKQPYILVVESIFKLNKVMLELIKKFNQSLKRKFALQEIPKKLQEWHKLSFVNFIGELSKLKIKLTISEEAEWEEYFNAERKKVLDILAEIESTDKEIDQMVYKLYELTEEEIRIVESGN